MSGTHELFFFVRRKQSLLVAALAMCFIAPTASAVPLFISDSVNDVIHRIDSVSGAAIGPDIPLSFAMGVATGSNGDLFAVSQNPPQVYRYNPTTGAQIGGPYVTYFGLNDGRDVYGPTGMAFAPNGNLYIADTTASNVHVYDTAGNSVTSLTSLEMAQPTDVAFDGAGNLYVVNPGMADVLVSLGGTQPLTEFVTPLSGGLTIPQALTFGPDGKLYVLDASNSGGPAVRRYTSAGADDGTFVSYASTLFQPNDVAFGPDGKLYVSGIDLGSNVGQVLRYLPNGTADGSLTVSFSSYPTYMAFAVPEPTTLVLMLMAGGVLLFRRR